MPSYEYKCRECKKTFTRIMTLQKYERRSSVACPHCKSTKVEQKPAAFFAVTARKS